MYVTLQLKKKTRQIQEALTARMQDIYFDLEIQENLSGIDNTYIKIFRLFKS